MYYIGKKDVLNMKRYVFDRNIEYCGSLLRYYELKNNGLDPLLATYNHYSLTEKDNMKEEDKVQLQGQLVISVEVKGEPDKCLVEKYQNFHFHTHSIISKGYPSYQDINLAIFDQPETFFIFTIFGVWEFTCMKSNKFKDRTKKKEVAEQFNKYLEEIYFNTDRGRANPLSETMINTVNNIIKKIENKLSKFKLKMSLTTWEDIEKMDKYILKTRVF